MTERAGAPPDITPVLVTYNSAGILGWSLPPLADCPAVVVVDNRSADDTVARLRELLPRATLIEAGRNLGFGRANNLGLEAVSTPWALLHNPDARLEPGALWALHEAARHHPEAAIIAPALWDQEGDAPPVIADFFRGPWHANASRPAPEPVGELCAEFVTGAAMLLNMTLMRRVGFFDPWFFLYFEDDELCLRVRAAGLPILVVPQARMRHRVRQSSTPSARTTLRRIYCMTLSKLYLTRKVFGTGACVALALRSGLASALALPFMLLTLQRERAMRHAARAGAALMAWRHLRRAHCFEPER